MSADQQRTTRLWLTGILLFAAVARLLYVLDFRAADPLYDNLLHDAKSYHELAAGLAAGEGWGPGPFYQAPLYPFLVSLVYRAFGPVPGAVYAGQAVLGLALLLLLHRVASRGYGARSARYATALGALYGVFAFHETKLLPATLTALLTLLAVERFQRADAARSAWPWLTAGAAVGLAALAAPGSLLLAPLALAWIGVDRARTPVARAGRAAMLIAGVALIVGPVTLRNARTGDLALISTNGGITFFQGNNPRAAGLFSAPEGLSGSIFRQREESRRLAERQTGRPMRASEVSSHWFAKGREFLLGHPWRALWLLSRKAGFALDNYEHPLEYNPHLDGNPWRWLMPLPFALILALAALRPFSNAGASRAETPLWLLLTAQTAILLLFYVSGRYRLPAVPALLALAGCGAAALHDRARAGARRSAAPLLVATTVAAFSFLYAPLREPDLRRSQETMGWCDRAGAYLADGDTRTAIALYRRATRLDPRYPYAFLDLGRALLSVGELDAADRALSRAAELAPRLAEARFDLGFVRSRQGRLDDAVGEFAEAFRLDPSSAEAANNLAGTCIRAGRFDEAVRAWREMKRLGLPVDPPIEAWMESRDLAP